MGALVVLVWPCVAGAQAGGQVELLFQLPPGFSSDNLPANVDESQEEGIVLGNDYLAVEATTLGTRQERPAAPAEPGAAKNEGQEGNVTAPSHNASIGIDTTVSEDFQFFTIPIGYRPRPDLNVSLALPFLRRTGSEGEVMGLGDLSASLGVRWGSPLKLLGITTLFVKAPTGRPDAEDAGEFLPTGSGSWDYALYQTFIKRFGRSRGELTVGYRVNTAADFDAGGADIRLENGDVVNLIVGVDREVSAISGLVGTLRVDTRYIQETDLSVNGVDQTTPGDLLVVDVLPEMKYFLGPGLAFRLGLRLPVNNIHDRGPALDFGVVQRF